MKLFRLTNNGWVGNFAIINNKVYVLLSDPVTALKLYSEGKEVPLGPEVNVNVDELLNRDYTYRGLRFTRPYDPIEVWGSGIVYEVARSRYTEEDVAMIKGKTIYELVYDAERPEIFFKGTANRCVGHGEPIAVRSDSEWTLPEPELGVVIDSRGKILAYTVSDDVSARDLEAQNPLYLPQSKIYNNSCAMGPFLVTPDEVGNPYDLTISMRIIRGSAVVFEGSISTSKMRRRVEDQIKYLIRDNAVPDGTLLSTGTAVIPPRPITLMHGDVVEISITRLGTQRTPVIKLGK
ncbi:fumarylacetoacetate hydrolase family protein [Vulcanisaeta souniana]|uniref:Fumarylacetoacetate (FAA) hydrolase n=1 Tax=Vulcanisaeta souniana JCM 11219 TaxID=1293586 RepID=A0A830EI93_9CREN|nr:fumarylacetoacetate hydrolase family protein [Vulcanisaeta souniana]BDR92636.1 fumarylacetoacetate hydrolase [Vulcanisaeta souniana JCM 11219]GGI87602.1 fumarylacetoacetate (FAA) hydrolase [Vulcanisaeta souniana JCM 11219]